MSKVRLLILAVAGMGLLGANRLPAADVPAPFDDAPYSADVSVSYGPNEPATAKIFGDKGKLRIEPITPNVDFIKIIRPDLNKVYTVPKDNSKASAEPYDDQPAEVNDPIYALAGGHGKFEEAGSETVEGVACTKYKATTDLNKNTFYCWVDAKTKAPVKMAMADNSDAIVWKNYKAGPQDAKLFEPGSPTPPSSPSTDSAPQAGGSLVPPASPSPFDATKPFSAEVIVDDGTNHSQSATVYSDGDKLRFVGTEHGTDHVLILRPDLKKVYQVMMAGKEVTVEPHSAEQMERITRAVKAPQGHFELIGPETMEGVACTKYKVTSADKAVYFFWVDAAAKIPVKMATENNNITVTYVWKNFKAGPQEAKLFEPPTEDEVPNMPPQGPLTPVAPPPGAGGP